MTKQVQELDHVIIRFAGDSGDGMQLTGDRFTQETAVFGNDLSTLPNFPAEIRAPAGTLPGAGLAHLGPAVWAELAFLAFGSTVAGLLLWNVAVLAGDITLSVRLWQRPKVKQGGRYWVSSWCAWRR